MTSINGPAEPRTDADREVSDLRGEVERLRRELDEARKDLAIARREIDALNEGDPFAGPASEDGELARLFAHFETWALLRELVESDAITEADLAGKARIMVKKRACDVESMRRAYDVNRLEAVARAAADLAKHERTLRDNTVPVREHIAAQDGQRAAWRVLLAALDQWKGQP